MPVKQFFCSNNVKYIYMLFYKEKCCSVSAKYVYIKFKTLSMTSFKAI